MEGNSSLYPEQGGHPNTETKRRATPEGVPGLSGAACAGSSAPTIPWGRLLGKAKISPNNCCWKRTATPGGHLKTSEWVSK